MMVAFSALACVALWYKSTEDAGEDIDDLETSLNNGKLLLLVFNNIAKLALSVMWVIPLAIASPGFAIFSALPLPLAAAFRHLLTPGGRPGNSPLVVVLASAAIFTMSFSLRNSMGDASIINESTDNYL